MFLPLTSLLIILAVCNGKPSQHIVGGEESEKGRWPWMLSLQRLRLTGEYSHTCGAALLTPSHILTAAHCVQASQNPQDYRVLVGAFYADGSDAEDIIHLKNFTVHEGYNPNNPPGVPNDVAVAELEREVSLTLPGVGLGNLPRHGDVFSGNPNCYATGWGRFDPNVTDASPVLKQLNANIWTKDECKTMWNNLYPGFGLFIQDEHVCIAGPDDGVCHGDSGSPLNCDMTGEGDWVIAGVASWASGAQCIGATGVYASVEYFLDWFQANVPGLPGVKP